MERWIRFGAVTFLSLCASESARAQVVGALDVAGGIGRNTSAPWSRESRIAPALRFAGAPGFVFADGLFIERASAVGLERASFTAGALSPSFGSGLLRLSVSGRAASDSASAERWGDATGELALSARLRRSGAWLGTAFDRHTPSLVVGAWRSFSSAVFSVTSRSAFGTSTVNRVAFADEQGWDSVFTDTSGWQRYRISRTVTDTTTVARLLTSRVLEARLAWGTGRWSLDANLMRHTATDSVRARTIGRATATMRLNGRTAMFASAGTAAGPFARSVPARFGTLGVRLSPASLNAAPLPAPVRPSATAFVASALTDGRYRFVLRVPSARTVEISGDFTNWQPVALREISANVWEVALPVTAGTHRVNVRVNGDAWTAPPGTPTVDDEFSGRVGIFVAQ